MTDIPSAQARDFEALKQQYPTQTSQCRAFLMRGYPLPAYTRHLMAFIDELVNENKKMTTIATHLASLRWWHKRYGYTDPTDDPDIRDHIKQQRSEHNEAPQQAPAMVYPDLECVVAAIDAELAASPGSDVLPSPHRAALLRDKALLCVGFWRAFRASDLVQLRVKDYDSLRSRHGEPMLYIRKGKGDRSGKGKDYPLAAVSDAYRPTCPVRALNAWLTASQLREDDAIFCSLREWHKSGDKHVAKALHVNAVINIVNQRAAKVGLKGYTSHSLRAGFVTEFSDTMTDTKIAEYGGWSNVRHVSTYRRKLVGLPFVDADINAALSQQPTDSHAPQDIQSITSQVATTKDK
ncbi:MAG: hypothetical protein C9356_20225 [Oleiphilus sp.]|nr:MAG: hypothetical protein C9356_20225 [Oleiphilus sp.]